jgi:hypothetical protein
LALFAARLRTAILVALAFVPASTLVVTLTHVLHLSKVDVSSRSTWRTLARVESAVSEPRSGTKYVNAPRLNDQ